MEATEVSGAGGEGLIGQDLPMSVSTSSYSNALSMGTEQQQKSWPFSANLATTKQVCYMWALQAPLLPLYQMEPFLLI